MPSQIAAFCTATHLKCDEEAAEGCAYRVRMMMSQVRNLLNPKKRPQRISQLSAVLDKVRLDAPPASRVKSTLIMGGEASDPEETDDGEEVDDGEFSACTTDRGLKKPMLMTWS